MKKFNSKVTSAIGALVGEREQARIESVFRAVPECWCGEAGGIYVDDVCDYLLGRYQAKCLPMLAEFCERRFGVGDGFADEDLDIRAQTLERFLTNPCWGCVMV